MTILSVAGALVAFGGVLFYQWWDGRDVRDYPPAVRANFVRACQAQPNIFATRDYCYCALESIENEFSFGQFVEREQTYSVTGIMPGEFIDAAAEC